MRKHTFLALTLTLLANTTALLAQQEPMFTKYMFNSLSFNPAYAGSHDHLTLNAIRRQQWIGLEGAPTTYSIIAHSPLRNDRVGVGASLINDQIGVTGTLDGALSYAYHIPVGRHTKLSIGLQAGVTNWRGNWDLLTLEDPNDGVFQENVNKWLPNFGTGLYLYNRSFYAGLGCPKLVEYDLRRIDATSTPIYAKSYRHYFATLGGAVPLGGDNLVLKPSLLVKSVDWFSTLRKDTSFQKIGAPTEIDVDISFFFLQTLWLGVAYRTAIERELSSDDSIDFWMAYFFKNGLRLGAAYDYTLTDIQRVSSGSFEIMVGYEFDYKTKRVVTPRYF